MSSPPTTATAHATMSFADWTEDPPWDGDPPLPRLASSSVTFTYTGDLIATSQCRYALSYAADGAGHAIGFEAVEGTLAGLSGAFVLRHDAEFTATGVAYLVTVVPDSATGELTGLLGEGTCQAEHGAEDSSWSLTYRLP